MLHIRVGKLDKHVSCPFISHLGFSVFTGRVIVETESCGKSNIPRSIINQ